MYDRLRLRHEQLFSPLDLIVRFRGGVSTSNGTVDVQAGRSSGNSRGIIGFAQPLMFEWEQGFRLETLVFWF